MPIFSAPSGSVGWTRTGSASASISAQTGAKHSSVRLFPAMLPYLVGRFEMGDRVEFDHLREIRRKPTDYLRH
ncbi:MAG: hypothetical protein ACKODG_06775, partial [Betaproteobacteria bacterium]